MGFRGRGSGSQEQRRRRVRDTILQGSFRVGVCTI